MVGDVTCDQKKKGRLLRHNCVCVEILLDFCVSFTISMVVWLSRDLRQILRSKNLATVHYTYEQAGFFTCISRTFYIRKLNEVRLFARISQSKEFRFREGEGEFFLDSGREKNIDVRAWGARGRHLTHTHVRS